MPCVFAAASLGPSHLSLLLLGVADLCDRLLSLKAMGGGRGGAGRPDGGEGGPPSTSVSTTSRARDSGGPTGDRDATPAGNGGMNGFQSSGGGSERRGVVGDAWGHGGGGVAPALARLHVDEVVVLLLQVASSWGLGSHVDHTVLSEATVFSVYQHLAGVAGGARGGRDGDGRSHSAMVEAVRLAARGAAAEEWGSGGRLGDPSGGGVDPALRPGAADAPDADVPWDALVDALARVRFGSSYDHKRAVFTTHSIALFTGDNATVTGEGYYNVQRVGVGAVDVARAGRLIDMVTAEARVGHASVPVDEECTATPGTVMTGGAASTIAAPPPLTLHFAAATSMVVRALQAALACAASMVPTGVATAHPMHSAIPPPTTPARVLAYANAMAQPVGEGAGRADDSDGGLAGLTVAIPALDSMVGSSSMAKGILRPPITLPCPPVPRGVVFTDPTAQVPYRLLRSALGEVRSLLPLWSALPAPIKLGLTHLPRNDAHTLLEHSRLWYSYRGLVSLLRRRVDAAPAGSARVQVVNPPCLNDFAAAYETWLPVTMDVVSGGVQVHVDDRYLYGDVEGGSGGSGGSGVQTVSDPTCMTGAALLELVTALEWEEEGLSELCTGIPTRQLLAGEAGGHGVGGPSSHATPWEGVRRVVDDWCRAHAPALVPTSEAAVEHAPSTAAASSDGFVPVPSSKSRHRHHVPTSATSAPIAMPYDSVECQRAARGVCKVRYEVEAVIRSSMAMVCLREVAARVMAYLAALQAATVPAAAAGVQPVSRGAEGAGGLGRSAASAAMGITMHAAFTWAGASKYLDHPPHTNGDGGGGGGGAGVPTVQRSGDAVPAACGQASGAGGLRPPPGPGSVPSTLPLAARGGRGSASSLASFDRHSARGGSMNSLVDGYLASSEQGRDGDASTLRPGSATVFTADSGDVYALTWMGGPRDSPAVSVQTGLAVEALTNPANPPTTTPTSSPPVSTSPSASPFTTQATNSGSSAVSPRAGDTEADEAAQKAAVMARVREKKERKTADVRNPLWKSILCHFHKRGRCVQSRADCFYAHGKEDLRPVHEAALEAEGIDARTGRPKPGVKPPAGWQRLPGAVADDDPLASALASTPGGASRSATRPANRTTTTTTATVTGATPTSVPPAPSAVAAKPNAWAKGGIAATALSRDATGGGVVAPWLPLSAAASTATAAPMNNHHGDAGGPGNAVPASSALPAFLPLPPPPPTTLSLDGIMPAAAPPLGRAVTPSPRLRDGDDCVATTHLPDDGGGGLVVAGGGGDYDAPLSLLGLSLSAALVDDAVVTRPPAMGPSHDPFPPWELGLQPPPPLTTSTPSPATMTGLLPTWHSPLPLAQSITPTLAHPNQHRQGSAGWGLGAHLVQSHAPAPPGSLPVASMPMGSASTLHAPPPPSYRPDPLLPHGASGGSTRLDMSSPGWWDHRLPSSLGSGVSLGGHGMAGSGGGGDKVRHFTTSASVGAHGMMPAPRHLPSMPVPHPQAAPTGHSGSHGTIRSMAWGMGGPPGAGWSAASAVAVGGSGVGGLHDGSTHGGQAGGHAWGSAITNHPHVGGLGMGQRDSDGRALLDSADATRMPGAYYRPPSHAGAGHGT